jgi:N6-L-threonylcarbamoyladenine synthase
MAPGLLILGIETSCDETAAAVVRNGCSVLSSEVASQVKTHAPYGGVVPELAGRKHLENLIPVVRTALDDAGVEPHDLAAIAITSSPGLLGALLVGTTFAKSLAMGWSLPLVEVNHLYAHALSIFLDRRRPRFPFLSLVASGGHTSLFEVTSPLQFKLVGRTRDDAAGEVIDKFSKFLGLGYPGGPIIDSLARNGDPDRVRFPRGLQRSPTSDFSFSGLKTAVVNHVLGSHTIDGRLADHHAPVLDEQERCDLAASFQEAVVDSLVEKTVRAARERNLATIVVSGGVAANSRLRRKMAAAGNSAGQKVLFPSPRFCTDNAAMVAGAAAHLVKEGRLSSFSFRPSARMKNGH